MRHTIHMCIASQCKLQLELRVRLGKAALARDERRVMYVHCRLGAAGHRVLRHGQVRLCDCVSTQQRLMCPALLRSLMDGTLVVQPWARDACVVACVTSRHWIRAACHARRGSLEYTALKAGERLLCSLAVNLACHQRKQHWSRLSCFHRTESCRQGCHLVVCCKQQRQSTPQEWVLQLPSQWP
jgi:hypothetical protein